MIFKITHALHRLYGALAAALSLAISLTLAAPARAHDPFDGSTDMMVFDERIELTITLGYDATRALVGLMALPPAQRLGATRPGQRAIIDLPVQAAPLLMQLSGGGQTVAATAFVAAPDRDETAFRIVYPRPPGATVQLRASYFAKIEHMRPGTVRVIDQRRRLIASAMLTAAKPQAALALQLDPAITTHAAAIGGASSFADYFRLGVEHILTGFDHLLFLAALLLAVRRIKPMLIIVTAFTLAHSVTLALAALDVIMLPPTIIEPLIAASIIVVGIDNLLRREATADRYWMAGLFGLIHGVGFAGLLRATALAQRGGAMIKPLLGFNLGVESGQLMVAALALPLLLLLRRQPWFERYGVPALSVLVIAVSAVWMMQRLAGGFPN